MIESSIMTEVSKAFKGINFSELFGKSILITGAT